MTPPTLSIHTHIDIRTAAAIVLLMEEQGIEHHSQFSVVARECILAVLKGRTVETVEEALDILASRTFPLKQLSVRGEGVKKHLVIENGALSERGDAIAKVLNGESDE